MKKFIGSITLSAAALTLLVGCGSGGGSGTNGTAGSDGLSPRQISGVAVDPELQGATVFIDRNGDGNLSAGEPHVKTDINGHYDLNATHADFGKLIVAQGGIDKVTKDPFHGKLLSIVDENDTDLVITPLSSLVAAYKKEHPDKSMEEIKEALAQKLGIDPEAFDEDVTKDPHLLSKSMLIASIAQTLQEDQNLSSEEILEKLSDTLAHADDLDDAITEVAEKHTKHKEIKEKIITLHQLVKGLEEEGIDNVDQLAMTIAQIDQNITDTKDLTKLKELKKHLDKLIVKEDEIAKLQKEKILKHAGIKHIDKEIEEQLFNGKDPKDLTPDILKEHILKNEDLKAIIEQKDPDFIQKLLKEKEQKKGSDFKNSHAKTGNSGEDEETGSKSKDNMTHNQDNNGSMKSKWDHQGNDNKNGKTDQNKQKDNDKSGMNDNTHSDKNGQTGDQPGKGNDNDMTDHQNNDNKNDKTDTNNQDKNGKTDQNKQKDNDKSGMNDNTHSDKNGQTGDQPGKGNDNDMTDHQNNDNKNDKTDTNNQDKNGKTGTNSNNRGNRNNK